MTDSEKPYAHIMTPSALDPLAIFAEINNSETPQKAMRELCRRARAHCNMHQPPFGLMHITKMLNVEVQRTSKLPSNIHGRLEWRGTGYVILASEHLSWRRLRSTVAHELGHLLLYRSLSKYPEALRALRSPTYWKEVEALCDMAASELLIPLDDLWSMCFPNLIHIYSTDLHLELYDRYLVSYTALFKRYLDVGVDAVLLWRALPSLDLKWRLASAYHKENFYIPPKISAGKHLFPNLLEDITPDKLDWRLYSSDIKLKFQANTISGECVAVASARNEPQPMFEGFRIADEPKLEFGAVMLIKTS